MYLSETEFFLFGWQLDLMYCYFFLLLQIVPTDSWTIPSFQLCGRPFLPDRSLSVGPCYLAGDCRSAGMGMSWPWLFLLALFGLLANFFDMCTISMVFS
jgi:hypothetical protein